MAYEVTLTVTARITNEALFKKTLLERTLEGFGEEGALALSPADQLFEVLIGSNPDVGPDEMGVEIVHWGGVST